MYKHTSQPRSVRKNHGFTLVELMIGIVISLFLVTAMSILYANMSQNRSELEKTNRQVENGRYAIEVIGNEIQLAGYWDDFLTQTTPNPTLADACETTSFGISSNSVNVPVGIKGFSAGSSSLACSSSAISSSSDTLLIRRLNTDTIAAASIPSNAGIYVQTSACASEISISKTLVVSNAAADFTLSNKDCLTRKPARKLSSTLYYVDSAGVLRAQQRNGASISDVALVDGIEFIHYEFSLDRMKNGTVANDGVGDGIPDATSIPISEIQDTCNVSSKEGYCWSNVVGVTIYVLARNTEPTVGYAAPSTYTLGSATYTVPTASASF